jgi:putative endonuclease
MADTNQRVGKFGEWLAAEHLVGAGMRLVDQNWRCRLGEIDIVAWDGETIVFCEVKTRRGVRYGVPAAAVVRAKRQRLRRLAAEWLKTTGHRARDVRFDVVSVLPQPHGAPRIEHIKCAF